MSFLTLLLMPFIITGGSFVVDWGYNSLSLKDVAVSKGIRAVEVSPVALVGNGYHFGILFKTGYWKQHSVGIYLDYTRNFRYDSGIHTLGKPEDKRWDFTLRYNFDHYLLKELMARFDVGIGPRLFISYINTQRSFTPEVKLNFKEWLVSPSFVITMRYRMFKPLEIKMSLANGSIFGFEQTQHNLYGTMPARNPIINNWHTEFSLHIMWSGLEHFDVIIYYGHIEQVKTGKIFQQIVAGDRLGFKFGYKWSERR